MSITTYAELQTAVAAWVHRDDLTSLLPTFIDLAEAKLNRRLRLRAMETVATGTVASSVTLPDGFLELISLTVTDAGIPQPLRYVPADRIKATDGPNGYFSVIGSTLRFEGVAGGTYALTYYKRFDPLADGENWLITNAPDIYLYACVIEVAIHTNSDAELQKATALLNTAIERLETAERADRFGHILAVRAG